MWIEARECVPFADGEYLVQTVYGRVTAMNYTHKGGWNTHYDSNGVMQDTNSIEYEYIARWCKVEKPKAVPEAWLKEYKERKVSECATE